MMKTQLQFLLLLANADRARAADDLRSLLANGVDVSFSNSEWHSACHKVAEKGRSDLLIILLDAGAGVNELDEQGQTPCFLAARNGHADAVRLLIEAGAKVKIPSAEQHDSALHVAARGGHADVVKLLIAGGADVNAINLVANTPLHCAARAGHSMVVRALIAAGATVDIPARDGRTPLVWSVWKCAAESTLFLIAGGADVNMTQAQLHTALHLVDVYDGSGGDIAEMLIVAGANIEAVNMYRDTPLMRAVELGRTRLVRLLLAAGANTQALTAKSVANVQHIREMADLLANAANIPRGIPTRPQILEKIETAKCAITLDRFRFVQKRALVVCVGMQALELPALVTFTILDAMCELTSSLPMHLKWKLIIAVKHHRDQ